MKILSLKLKDEVFEDLEKVMKTIKLSRNAYINKAIEHYNKAHRKYLIKKQLHIDSRLVAEESLKTAQELQGLDNHFLDD